MLEHQATLSQISPAEIFVLSSPPSRPWWQPEASSSRASGKKAASGHAHSNVTAMYTTYTSLSSTVLADDQKIHCWSVEASATSIPVDELSWQLLGASLEASGAARSFS